MKTSVSKSQRRWRLPPRQALVVTVAMWCVFHLSPFAGDWSCCQADETKAPVGAVIVDNGGNEMRLTYVDVSKKVSLRLCFESASEATGKKRLVAGGTFATTLAFVKSLRSHTDRRHPSGGDVWTLTLTDDTELLGTVSGSVSGASSFGPYSVSVGKIRELELANPIAKRKETPGKGTSARVKLRSGLELDLTNLTTGYTYRDYVGGGYYYTRQRTLRSIPVVSEGRNLSVSVPFSVMKNASFTGRKDVTVVCQPTGKPHDVTVVGEYGDLLHRSMYNMYGPTVNGDDWRGRWALALSVVQSISDFQVPSAAVAAKSEQQPAKSQWRCQLWDGSVWETDVVSGEGVEMKLGQGKVTVPWEKLEKVTFKEKSKSQYGKLQVVLKDGQKLETEGRILHGVRFRAPNRDGLSCVVRGTACKSIERLAEQQGP